MNKAKEIHWDYDYVGKTIAIGFGVSVGILGLFATYVLYGQ